MNGLKSQKLKSIAGLPWNCPKLSLKLSWKWSLKLSIKLSLILSRNCLWKCLQICHENQDAFLHDYKTTTLRSHDTPARTLSISGLKSRVLKLSFLSLKFILKSTEPLQRYLLSCQANSAILGSIFALGSSNSEGARSISK